MPYSGDPTIAHYRSMLADFEYELKVETRRQGPSVFALQAAIERTRNTLSALLIRRGAQASEPVAEEPAAANDFAA